MSGSVGTYIHFPAAAEEKALRRLGLKACRVSSQIIQRDRHAEVISALALLGTTLEKIAVEIRHLQKTETLEAEEPFTRGQKGSSSMPHKRNPVRCERVSGLARVLRGHAAVALENNVLWHERDISHSSAERIIFPDSFHLAVFMLEDLTDVMRNLVVYPENIRRNLELTQGVYFSQKVLTLLVDKGLARQRAYELVQALAMRSWREKRSFRELVLADPAIVALCPAAELERAFSLQDLLAGTRDIFKRFSRKK
jgi:adenylosuccinate lyase